MIWTGEWDWRLKIVDWGLGLEIGIGDWDWALGLGIGIGDWIRIGIGDRDWD